MKGLNPFRIQSLSLWPTIMFTMFQVLFYILLTINPPKFHSLNFTPKETMFIIIILIADEKVKSRNVKCPQPRAQN